MFKVPFVSIILLAIAFFIVKPAINDKEKIAVAEQQIATIKEVANKDVNISENPSEKETEVTVETEEVVLQEVEEYVSPYNFEELKNLNSDIIAWIKINNTAIDYPILFDGTDQYLYMSLGGDNTPSGSIYVDATAEEALNESINIIYGHHMKDGSMFAAIDDYSYDEFWNNHQEITIYMEDKELDLVPSFCVVGKSDASLRDISDVETLNNFLDGKTITQGEVATEFDNFYVFVTCNYTGENYRTYLFCTERSDGI